ncbi:unnamed protein product [Paramecium primaurelia]|uniref:Transmembrane protein n=1 Tax=Paramecium primaurelia TaxID=5886 RepID=A0A8S1JLR5_PARPR|nr:unnamed protein product [Paramecium primaurelia]
MEVLCCICECCFPDTKRSGFWACVCCILSCYSSYLENIYGRKKRTFRFLNSILILILSIVALVLTNKISLNANLSTEELTNIFQNWQIGALIDIQILEQQCPDKYETLSNYQIPQTDHGCICLNDQQIFRYGCDEWRLNSGCFNQQPKGPIDLFQWVQPSQNSFQTVQICGLRSQLKFYDLLQNKITTEEDCRANGYKICKTQQPENFQCVLEEESCPIRDIIITQYQLTDYDVRQHNYSLIYDNGFNVYISLQKETTPIINMTVVKGEGVCLNQNDLSLNPKLYEDYKLLSLRPSYCQLDDTYHQISTTNEEAFFNFNNVTALVQSERPLYNISSDIEYQLLAQKQIYFRQDCRIDSFQYIKNLNSRIEIQKTLITCQQTFAAVLFIYITVLVLNELNRCFYDCCPKCYAKAQLIIKEILIYLLGVTVIVNYALIYDLVLNFEKQHQQQCFPISAQERMNQIQITLSGFILSDSYSLLINICLMIIIDFAMSTFQCFKQYKKEQRLKKQLTPLTNSQLKFKPFLELNPLLTLNSLLKLNPQLKSLFNVRTQIK